MKFYKYNGAGNDFVIIPNLDGAIKREEYSALARQLCRRRVSVGADGLMLVEPSQKADLRMAFYNADGTEGEMCGNGARCICRFGFETGLSGRRQTVETVSGLVHGERLDKRRYRVRLTDPTVIRPHLTAEAEGRVYDCGYVELGTPGLPHAVVHVPGLRAMAPEELLPLGRALRYHPAFPKGANVNFFDLESKNHIYERTFERGVEDFTLACGTGTASAAIILALRGLTDRRGFLADMAGGTLEVDLEGEGDRIAGVYLTGPTTVVAAGDIIDEEL